MKSYLNILQKIIDEGIWKNNRTGIKTLSITGYMFEHNMNDGFPLLTTKKMAYKTMAVELEGFIKGISSKKWYQDRGCHIWDDWCNPKKIPYSYDNKEKMKAEDDLGIIYGNNWRNFGYIHEWSTPYEKNEDFIGKVDQLQNIVNTLKKDPTNRRMICSAWNPLTMDQAALPACHYAFQVLSDGENIDLLWNQRSCDTPLGIPFNIASYALLLTLLGLESGLKPRKLIGFLADAHIYENQIDGVKEQLSRIPTKLPTIEIPNFTNIFDWQSTQLILKDYESQPKIVFPIAV